MVYFEMEVFEHVKKQYMDFKRKHKGKNNVMQVTTSV